MPSLDLSSGHFALAGTVSRPPLRVNIVRLRKALGDACELRRRALSLEHALLGELAKEHAEEDEEAPPSPITVVPIDANTLAVVSDDVHASAVGLYLANIASCGLADFFVHAARDAEDNEEAIRSLLPNMLERALEYLPSERWSILGRSPDGLRVVRRRISDADPTSSPSSPFHHLESKNLDVLNFTTAPALDWGAGTNGGDRIVFPAIRPATIRMHPLGSIVAMLRSAKVPAEVIDGFRAGGDAQLCENEDPVLVTAVPLLHKEARVMSFLRRIPDRYGFESPDAYYADFSARYELVDGVPEMVWCDDDEGELRSDELFAELCFCDDGDERVRRLWPASLLIGPAGATEIPAATTEAKAAGMLTDLADDLRRYPDRLGVAMDLDREPGAGKGKGRSRKGPVATYVVPTTTKGGVIRLASQSQPPAPLQPRLEILVEDQSTPPKPAQFEPVPPGTAPRTVKVASFKPAEPTRAPLQPVTPVSVNVPDDDDVPDDDRPVSVDADPEPKVRKLVMSKHAAPAPAEPIPAEPPAEPADDTADDAMVDEMAAFLTEMDAAQPEMAVAKRKADAIAAPPTATEPKRPKVPAIARPAPPAVLTTKKTPGGSVDKPKTKRAPKKVIDPDEADAKIRKEHREGGDLNKCTGEEFKAFLTKAGEKPKGGLSKMAKPKLRELVDAVLANSQ